nr:hypothetical protein [Cherry necrotic rusty mottle virus]
MVFLAVENLPSSSISLILRILVLSLTAWLDPAVFLVVVLKRLFSHFNQDSTFLTSIYLEIITRVLTFCFPTLTRIFQSHLLLISSIAILIGLAFQFANFLTL